MSSLRDIFVQGFPADQVITRHLKANRKWGSQDRKVFAEAVYDIVRWWRRILYASHVPWPKQDRWDSGDVEAVRRAIAVWCWLHDVRLDETLWPRDLNAEQALRRWNETSLPRAIRESIPDWLDQLGERQLGPRWDELLRILNTGAPVFLRTNVLKTTSQELLSQLKQDRVDAALIEGECLQLSRRANVFLAKTFKLGHFEVQDLHSQRVAIAVAPQPGERVVDACAGAGGKSLHLASLMKNKGKIIALDVVEKKLVQLRERATRDGVTLIEARLIESQKTIKRLRDTADRVLLDVPCSGLGVLRRNPDSKWKLNLAEIEKLIEIQGEILNSYAQMCKPSGRLVYATCSILPDENEHRVAKFISQNETKWSLESEQTLAPYVDGGDGFYIACLKRS